jgi:hypothetical protein
MNEPTCKNCIVYLRPYYVGDPADLRQKLCEELRSSGACLVQNSQRVIVVVAPEAIDVSSSAVLQAVWRLAGRR